MKARDNPFRVERLEAIPFIFQAYEWDEVLRHLSALSYRAAILGGQGTGKTAFLLELLTRLRQQGFSVRMVTVRRESLWGSLRELWRVCFHLSRNDIFFLDGADALPAVLWRLLAWYSRRFRGCIVTSHQRRLLPTLLICRSDAFVLERIINQLLPTATAGNVCMQAPALLEKHQGNIRNVLRELYDRYAETG